MKTHIISLQRTGSKSLHNAIEAASPHKLLRISREGGSDSLGEFFHCWGKYGYKFVGGKYPFDPAGQVYFRTHPDFANIKAVNYGVMRYGYELVYSKVHYQEHLIVDDVLYRAFIIKWAQDCLVKTQLTSLTEEIDMVGDEEYLLHQLNADFTHTIFLVPGDVVRWVCSNYVADHTGIFVSCPEQDAAKRQLKSTAVAIPLHYIETLLDRLRRHLRVTETWRRRGCLILKTEELCSPEVTDALSSYLRFPVEVQNTKEFSECDYSEIISNYDAVSDFILKNAP